MDGSHSGHVAAGLTSVRQILWAEYSFKSTDTQAVYRQCTDISQTNAHNVKQDRPATFLCDKIRLIYYRVKFKLQ